MRFFQIILISLMVCVVSLSASDIAVTIYNGNMSLVRDVRENKFEMGRQVFEFTDVAASIDPTSVHFKSLTAPGQVHILEQNFEYDLVGMDRLLETYLDQTVQLVTRQENFLQGKLASSNNGYIVLMTQNGKVRAIAKDVIEHVEFPELPAGLKTRPTLVWLLDADKAGTHKTEISYLTGDMSWDAQYVGVVNEDDDRLELSAWVSIHNTSGATYKDAVIKLVAGDLNKASEEKRVQRLDRAMVAAEAPQQFQQEELFEYHLYRLQRPATLKDRQVKQISLFSPQTAPAEKRFIYDGQKQKVRVDLEFMNSEENGLGMPLPKGKVRVYKESKDGAQEFIGEDRIDHTPKDERVRLTLGNAFDVVGERTVKSRERVTSNTRQETVEISLRNHKQNDITVTVVEHFWGDWEFVGSTPKISRRTATLCEFAVDVAADQEKTFTYTVLYRQ
ncbi:MAG: DUF4139 domain-containing protein [candidate division KSB1 bacterium]|nr:DUF4139 domain-containing protein [candidate division KSB1 bacterium]